LINRTNMLAIYRARPVSDTAGPGAYAIKTLASQPSDFGLALALLRREAAVAAEVSHPHLVTVLAARLAVPRPYLVLPYLEGVTLRRRMETPPLPVATALWIVRQVAEALTALHAAGWLHGQVRPEHVDVSPQGHATLIDLTEARRARTAECDSGDFPRLVAAYAAPEAFSLRGRLTAASDTYALGIVLYEALAGRPPFAAADPRQLAAMQLRVAPPNIRQLRPGASLEIGELLHRMLAKEPLRRPSDDQLVRWLAELEIEELAS
jgi:serine/threonine protein kinase